jgi:hypothetical protein
MLGAGSYPITLAEMQTYSQDVDRIFSIEEHERLKTFLALHPENGDVLIGTNGVRVLKWPIKVKKNESCLRIVYLFRDLNMPLYLLAVYEKGEKIPMGAIWKQQIAELVNELVDQHCKRWALVMGRQDSSA